MKTLKQIAEDVSRSNPGLRRLTVIKLIEEGGANSSPLGTLAEFEINESGLVARNFNLNLAVWAPLAPAPITRPGGALLWHEVTEEEDYRDRYETDHTEESRYMLNDGSYTYLTIWGSMENPRREGLWLYLESEESWVLYEPNTAHVIEEVFSINLHD